MTLYLYRTGTTVPVLTIENAKSYTADHVTALNSDGNPVVYSLAEIASCQQKRTVRRPCGQPGGKKIQTRGPAWTNWKH